MKEPARRSSIASRLPASRSFLLPLTARCLVVLALFLPIQASSCASATRIAEPDRQIGGPPDAFVDRIEGDLAVLVTSRGGVVDWPAAGLGEGDVIVEGRVDHAATQALRLRVRARRGRLSEEDEGLEDLDLRASGP